MTEVREIIEIYRRDNPESSDIYTEEWVLSKCSRLGMTPAELLAELHRQAAILVDYKPKPYPDDWPEWVKVKFGKVPEADE